VDRGGVVLFRAKLGKYKYQGKKRFKIIDNLKPDWKYKKYYEDLIQLKYSYWIIGKIYEIYDNKNNTVESWKQEFKKLINWTINRLSDTIIEIRNMWNTLNNHLWWISNYFKFSHTNSIAEWLNSRIRRVLSNSRWFKNFDYMIYRILRLFW